MKTLRYISAALFLLTIILGSTVAQAQSESTPCSVDDSISTFVVLTNTTLHNLNFYWINYDCKEEQYGTMEPGQSVVLQTFVTHPWIVRRADTGAQVGEIIVPDSEMPLVHEIVCSLSDNIETSITVINNSDAPAKFYWIDYDCNEVEYGTLAPGESFIQSTYNTHPWILRDANTGAIIGSTVATALAEKPE